MSQYLYHLKFWGEIENEEHNYIQKELGITETDFWFINKEERTKFKKKLITIAENHKVVIAFSEHEGTEVNKKCIASMTMVLPDGRKFPYKYDFGYGYPLESAEYMWLDGNYSCDCNKSLFLSRKYPDCGIDEDNHWNCGDLIVLEDFKVYLEEVQ